MKRGQGGCGLLLDNTREVGRGGRGVGGEGRGGVKMDKGGGLALCKTTPR